MSTKAPPANAGSAVPPPPVKSIAEITEEIVKNATSGYEPGSFPYMAVEKMTRMSVYAFTEPMEFLLNLGIILTPLLLIALFCAYKLTKSAKKSAGRKPGGPGSKSSGKPERQMPPRAAKKSKKDN